MAAKRYHIGRNGEPAVCHARGKCPLGGASGTENHFTNYQDALKRSEELYESKFVTTSKSATMSRKTEMSIAMNEMKDVARNLLNEIDVQENLDNQDEVAHTYRVQGNVITFIGEFEEDDQPPHYQFDLDGVKTKDELKSKLHSFLDGFDAKHQADVDGAYMEINGVRHYNDELLAMYEADEDWLKGIASKI